MINFEIIAIKYAESTIEESAVIKGGNPDIRIPISFTIYLIKTPESNILVDAGCTTMPGWDMKYFCSPADILKDYGIMPEDINSIILTHEHHDHVEGVYLFKNATVYMQEDEYKACSSKIPESMSVKTFKDELIVNGFVKAKRIGGHTKGSCVVMVDNYVICGDECYTERCFEEQIPTGISANITNSKAFIEEYGKPEYIRLLCHDGKILPGQNGCLKII